ncbi:MAG TPA: histidine phosphotransferase family protein [Caulobacterales bacterium]|nr:histidine phosphotransferase family protein [Caulobacterales bacterium]
MIENTQLAALVASRLCHDLVEPIGAIIQGHEMIKGEDGKVDPDALSLLDQGVAKAWAKLEFFRFAVAGSAAAGDSQLEEGRDVAVRLFGALKPELNWQAPSVAMPRQAVRAVMGLLLIANECLPRGGTVEVTAAAAPDGAEVRIIASGARAALRAPTAAALRGEAPEGGLTGHTIQPYLAGLLARQNNVELLARESEDRVELIARSASFKL